MEHKKLNSFSNAEGAFDQDNTNEAFLPRHAVISDDFVEATSWDISEYSCDAAECSDRDADDEFTNAQYALTRKLEYLRERCLRKQPIAVFYNNQDGERIIDDQVFIDNFELADYITTVFPP